MSRCASRITGLRPANSPPVRRIGSNDIASSPVETAYRVGFSSAAVNCPSESVTFVSVLSKTGAPAIGVFCIISLKVTYAIGGVGVAVGVTVGVFVWVGVAVTVGVLVTVGVGDAVLVCVLVGVTVGVLVGV